MITPEALAMRPIGVEATPAADGRQNRADEMDIGTTDTRGRIEMATEEVDMREEIGTGNDKMGRADGLSAGEMRESSATSRGDGTIEGTDAMRHEDDMTRGTAGMIREGGMSKEGLEETGATIRVVGMREGDMASHQNHIPNDLGDVSMFPSMKGNVEARRLETSKGMEPVRSQSIKIIFEGDIATTPIRVATTKSARGSTSKKTDTDYVMTEKDGQRVDGEEVILSPRKRGVKKFLTKSSLDEIDTVEPLRRALPQPMQCSILEYLAASKRALAQKVKPAAVGRERSALEGISEEEIAKEIKERKRKEPQRLTEERIAGMDIGDGNLTPQERGRIDPRYAKPARIYTIPHVPWNDAGWKYAQKEKEEVTTFLKEKMVSHVAEPSDSAYANRWFFLRNLNGKIRRSTRSRYETWAPCHTPIYWQKAPQGRRADPAKLDKLLNWPSPLHSPTEVRQFLGVVGYWRIFIRGYAEKAGPLRLLLRKTENFYWNSSEELAMQKLKDEFKEGGRVLGVPFFDDETERPFIVSTDAGPCSVGGLLSQKDAGGKKRPVRFESRTLNTAERNYSQFKKEVLAILRCRDTFRHYIYGRRFILRIDPTAVASVLQKDFSLTDPTIARWLIRIRLYDYTVEGVSGTKNAVADRLSRIPPERPIVAGALTMVEPRRAERFLVNLYEGKYRMIGLYLTVEESRDSKIRRQAAQYCLRAGHLFRRPVGSGMPLRVVCDPEERQTIVAELHDGVVGGYRGVKGTTKRYAGCTGGKGNIRTSRGLSVRTLARESAREEERLTKQTDARARPGREIDTVDTGPGRSAYSCVGSAWPPGEPAGVSTADDERGKTRKRATTKRREKQQVVVAVAFVEEEVAEEEIMVVYAERARKRRRAQRSFPVTTFGEPGCPADFDGPFRQNIETFLEEHAEQVGSSTFDGMASWTLIMETKEGSRFQLLVIEEQVEYSRRLHCDHCRCVGWSHHPVSNKRYHFILPAGDVYDAPFFGKGRNTCPHCDQIVPSSMLLCTFCGTETGQLSFFDLESHLLHGIFHSNGYGHLTRINGREKGSKYLSGRELMDLWDRICTMLRARKVSVEDVSKKRSLEFRLLHSVAYGGSWYGRNCMAGLVAN
ncbi:hypothetical protein CBR_g137 [Chara braunii]|uniref:Reverse transcriptase RNase H-like domain-containing protein n=1 Tax=Chara braunii TaxID=69332 RepID=A0A388JLQ7_CHABU|nr:hypothetical protein CBR_g137 [Chara braunii]|eukprot:GBG58737.1 hypothetical protein CBR_g137 [Chara braunii]